jgi:hypothetical protein
LELEIVASVHIEEWVTMQNTAMLSLYAFVLLAMILSSSQRDSMGKCHLSAAICLLTCCHLPAIFLHLARFPKKLSLAARQIIEVHVVFAQRRRCFPTANILNDLSNHFSYCQMLDVSSDLRPSRFRASNEVRMACNPASPKRKHHRNRQQVLKTWVDVP